MKSLVKKKNIVNRSIRRSAEGEECTIQGPNCSYDPQTTVFAHIDESFAGKGKGIKGNDFFGGFYACGRCHFDYENLKLDDKYYYLLRAVFRTANRMLEKGLIQIKCE